MTDELMNCIARYQQTQTQIERLEALRTTKMSERDTAQAAAVQLKTGLGERILTATLANDVGAESSLIDEAAMAGVKAEALTQLVTALEAKISEAQQQARKAHAACARADAARLEAEAAELQQPIDALLTQIKELAGVEYVPLRPERTFEMGQRIANGEFGRGPVNLGNPTRTKAEALAYQARCLKQAGDCIEHNTPIPTDIYTGRPLAKVPDYLAAFAAEEQ